MKIAFIHNEKKIQTGAHYINDLMFKKLEEQGVKVKNFYPRSRLLDVPVEMKGLQNILFFHSLLEHKNEILKCDLIQGTTYTTLALLPFNIPTVSHFGSTSAGFIKATPKIKLIEPKLRSIWTMLKKAGVIDELDIKTRRPLQDIAEIENFVARKSDKVIATSEIVKQNLVDANVPPENISVVWNSIEDFWFEGNPSEKMAPPGLIYLGRLGSDVFTMKLKGLDRMIYIWNHFKSLPKTSIALTNSKNLANWIRNVFENHYTFTNLSKERIKERLSEKRGQIFINPARYEGFCLSMIESMSQGLIPVSFPVGVAPEIIVNGVNGYIVNSAEEMEKVIKTIISNEDLRDQLSKSAIKTSKMFRADNMAKKLVKTYEKTIVEYKKKKKTK
ncbi:MAG: glycosyltransferase family 4 protein [Candidatus Colwellbacteria bacterium]|nr:glycosyltransferase family 4 protein [Candidatus Colwellbacteria bacterium]